MPYHGNPHHGGHHDIIDKCQQYMNYHVIAHMNDGTQHEGIIQDMDENGVTMLVPEEVDGMDRQFGFGGFGGYDGYDGYGGYGGYGGGYGRRRYRRYRRRRFPFSALAFPFIIPFPFYY